MTHGLKFWSPAYAILSITNQLRVSKLWTLGGNTKTLSDPVGKISYKIATRPKRHE